MPTLFESLARDTGPAYDDGPLVHQFTHIDLDGAGAAAIARRYLGGRVISTYHDYNTIDRMLEDHINTISAHKARHVLLITDISPKASTLKLLDSVKEMFIDVVLIDHHVGKKDDLEAYPWCHYTPGQCGTLALLVWFRTSFPWWAKKQGLDGAPVEVILREGEILEDLTDFAQAVNAYDIWDLKSPYRMRGENLHLLHGFLGNQTTAKLFGVQNVKADTAPDADTLLHILRDRQHVAVHTLIDDQQGNCRWVDKEGRQVGIFFASKDVSQIGETAQNRMPDLDYIVVFNFTYGKLELRSKRVDVSEIAKRFGGGGHKGAAGAPLKMRQFAKMFGEGFFGKSPK